VKIPKKACDLAGHYSVDIRMCYAVRLMQRRKAVVMTAIVEQRAVTRGLEKASLNHGGPAPSAVDYVTPSVVKRKSLTTWKY